MTTTITGALAVDVDEVLAGLHEAWLRAYNRRYGDSLVAFTEWDVHKQVKPECGMQIYDFLTPELYDEIEPVPGAVAAMQILVQRYQVIYVSACGNNTMANRKVTWLRDYGFPELPFIAAQRKHLVPGLAVLVDDHFDNCRLFEDPPHKRAVLVQRPHNANAEWRGLRVPDLISFAVSIV